MHRRGSLAARIALSLSALALHCALPAAEVTPEGAAFFEQRIRPVLADHCYECHSERANKIKGGLVLDSREGLRKGGDGGPVLVPGNPEKSRLIEAVRYHDEDLRMPPKTPLTAQQIKDFEDWVKMGAPDPRTNGIATAVANYAIDWEKARRFWSFQPIQDSPVPPVKNAQMARTAVDNFWLAKLEEKGLTPAAEADKRTLLRRVTFDLTGLPPTPEETEAFLADTSPGAFAKVVDRLLASPAYGERWGRHWLDVVRYADTSGCNSDYPVPTAYKYRDYVIDAFNRDKPYDQFLREQIAGDVLPAPGDDDRFENIIATGYLAISRRFGSRASEFHLTLEDTIDNVGKAMLGLSVSCARCHDHKFDPITAKDYYALYGVFQSTRYAFPGTEIYKHPKDFVPLATGTNAAAYFEHAAQVAELDDKIEKLQEIKAQFVRQEKAAQVAKAAKEDNEGAAQPPPKKVVVERKDAVKLPKFENITEVKAALEDARSELRRLENKKFSFEKAYAVREDAPRDAHLQRKGDPNNPGDVVPRGFLEILGGQQLPKEDAGSGRRALAEWITDPKNPLTARVMVNRIWQHHFGKGIVQTPNDFGARGKAPTHPELLDYLATRFIESDWSMKQMHRLLVLSRAYATASDRSAQPNITDPNNDYLAHFPRRRLSAEEVRDAMLVIGGNLDFGPAGEHPFPPENTWQFTQHRPFVADYRVYDHNKRSVYLMQQRIRKHPFLEIFDGADPNMPTGERPLSTTPLQALFLMNNEFAHRQADAFAVRVGMAFTETGRRIDYAHQLAFGRPATKDEVKAGEEYLRQIETALAEGKLPRDQRPRAALASYARVVLSANEFLYVD